MHKKRNIIIISSVSAAVIIGIIFLLLGLTIWRPKTTQEWLNDFKTSLAFNIDNHNQKTEKNINIIENEIEVAGFYQLVEIKEKEQRTVAHILIKENYPTLETDEFNIFDEYYFMNGTMYMYRKSGGEEIITNFASTWEVFWEIANENAGPAEYNFAENVFENLEILHEENLHKMSANIPDGNKAMFMGEKVDAEEMLDIALKVAINENLTLNSFALTYKTLENQNVNIKVESKIYMKEEEDNSAENFIEEVWDKDFYFEDVYCSSYESFVAATCYKTPQRQRETAGLPSIKAKANAQGKGGNKRTEFFWKGKKMLKNSKKYIELLEQAKVAQKNSQHQDNN